MNLTLNEPFAEQPEGAIPALTLLFEEWFYGMWVWGSYLVSRPCAEPPGAGQTCKNPTSPDVCMTPVLWLQHHLSSVTNWQLEAKDVFLIILHSLSAAVTTANAGMHAKLFRHVKISRDALKKDTKPLKLVFQKYWWFHLLLLTMETVPHNLV